MALLAATLSLAVPPGVAGATTGSAASDGPAAIGSMLSTTTMSGAREYWRAGFTGRGVDIAVIDTGVAPVDGLTAPGKVVNGPDLSFDSQVDGLGFLDAYGHGTHMASIAAGRDGEARSGGEYAADRTAFLGMAPDARIVNVKAGDARGAVDVTQVIAAIDWVVAHRHDNGLDIRVLNLSYGTDSLQSYERDPLAHAAERAWKAGIVVVVSAGNTGDADGGFAPMAEDGEDAEGGDERTVGKRSTAKGKTRAGLTMPAADPFVLAVGASDPQGTLTPGDDTVATFSAHAASARSRVPDLVAPGRSIEGLRVAGSLTDVTYPAPAGADPRLIRASGTSQAAAVVSGAAALLIQREPSLTPDGVKDLLRASARPLAGAGVTAQGAGVLDLTRVSTSGGDGEESEESEESEEREEREGREWRAARGDGSLEASRGSYHLELNGVVLQGEIDVFGRAISTRSLAAARLANRVWRDGAWAGRPWTGSTWGELTWAGPSWSRLRWSGDSWARLRWSDAGWSRLRWSSDGWKGEAWSRLRWSSEFWNGHAWS